MTSASPSTDAPATGTRPLPARRMEWGRAWKALKILIGDAERTDQVFEIIQQIRALGTTIFVVEQNANMALSIADRGYVIQTGEVVLADTAENLLANPLMREAYLGEL